MISSNTFTYNFITIDDFKEKSDNYFMLKVLKLKKTNYDLVKYLLDDLIVICFIDNGINHHMIDMNSKFKMLFPSVHKKADINEILEISKDLFTQIKPSVMEWSLEEELKDAFNNLKKEFFEPIYKSMKENPNFLDERNIKFEENWIFQPTKIMRKLKIRKIYD